MGLADKALQKYQMKKMIEQAMSSPQYQEAKKKDQEQAVLQAFRRLCFLGCEYLEFKHGYKHDGLEKFLKMMVARMAEIGEDETYFKDAENYYKDTYNLDVMKVLGLVMDEEKMDEK